MVNHQFHSSPTQTLIFLYLPKTRGSTIHQIIDRHYSIDRIFGVNATQVNESIQEFKNFNDCKCFERLKR